MEQPAVRSLRDCMLGMGSTRREIRLDPSVIDKCAMVFSIFGHWKKKKLRRFVNTIAQFTNVRSIHSGFHKWKAIDDNKKKFILHLAIDTEFFHSAFVNSCTLLNQRHSWSGVRLTAQLTIRWLIANKCVRWRRSFKGLSQDGGQAVFF